MNTKGKVLIGLMSITAISVCSFAFINSNNLSFTKAEDVIHTVTIDKNHNHLPESTGDYKLLNEVGTEINCHVEVYDPEKNLRYIYRDDWNMIDNSSKTLAIWYHITFFINGITSFEMTLDSTYDALFGTLYKGDNAYLQDGFNSFIIKDDDALCTSAKLDIPIVENYCIQYKSIIVSYNESSCRALSQK